jgi:hypothetical protein
LHRLNEEKGFRQFVQQLNLNADQQRYVRSELRPGQMVTLDRRSGLPVLVRPDNLGTDGKKMTDERLKDLMLNRVSRVLAKNGEFGLEVKESAKVSPSSQTLIDANKTRRTVLTRPFEESLVRTLDELLKCNDLEVRKKHASYFVGEAGRVAVSFDRSLASEAPEVRWIKVTERIVESNGLQRDVIELIMTLMGKENGKNEG